MGEQRELDTHEGGCGSLHELGTGVLSLPRSFKSCKDELLVRDSSIVAAIHSLFGEVDCGLVTDDPEARRGWSPTHDGRWVVG